MKPFTAKEARTLAEHYDPPEWLNDEGRERHERDYRNHYLIAAALRYYADAKERET